MVNKAVQGLITERFGAPMWDKIRTKAGLPDEPFVSMEQYPDESTYALVGAATTELGIGAAEILREFGRYWMLYTAQAGYGELLESAGRTFPEFVQNLDLLHSRVKLAFPHLRPPSFSVSELEQNRLTLHYFSSRAGLAPLVMGILDGLAERFRIKIDMQHETSAEGERPHERFRLTWREGGTPV